MGIDLGTTWCRACVLDGARSEELLIPSVVALGDEGRLVAGAEALAIAAHHPSRAVSFIKRLLGRKLYGPEITWLAGASCVELVPGDNGDAWVRLGTERFSPEELAATLFQTIADQARRRIGKDIERVVLAAPAIFDLPQRHALMHAADLVGLKPLRVIESGAAAVHALNTPKHVENVVTVDIGGGYFDICAIRKRPTGWTVLGSDGDPMLGGDDFDRRVVDLFISRFFEEHHADLTRSSMALHRLRHRARDVRHRASKNDYAGVTHLDNIAVVDNREVPLHHPPLSRDELAELWEDELDALWPACVRLFTDLGLGTEDVDALYVVGGATKLPAVQETLSELFRRQPVRPAAAELLSSRGAAALARKVGGGEDVVRSCFPHTLSVKVRDGKVSRVSMKNTMLPVTAGRLFAAVPRNQQTLSFEVYQGDADYARDNLYIARFIIHVIRNQRH